MPCVSGLVMREVGPGLRKGFQLALATFSRV